MLSAAWIPPLLLWFTQAAVGSSFFIAVLAREGIDNRFFAVHSLLLSSLWLAISCALGITDNYLFGLSILCLLAAWRFRSGDLSNGKVWLLLAALGGWAGVVRFINIPDDFSTWMKLWMLLSTYFGAFMLGVLYLSFALLFAPAGWIDDRHYAAHKSAILIEKIIYFRVLYQIGALVAIPLISDTGGSLLVLYIFHRPVLLAVTCLCGLLLPLMLLFPDDSEEQQCPHTWRFVALAISCSISVFTGARIYL